jgi:SOS-response transcriptional repressor LexA
MADETSRSWLFLSNHGTLLLSLAGHPTTGIGEIAELVGGSERGVQQIIGDLVAEGYLVRRREGRRDRHEINRKAHLRHPLFEDVETGPLIDALQQDKGNLKAPSGVEPL